MIVIAPALAFALAAGAPSGSDDGCAKAAALLSAPVDDDNRLDQLIEALPKEAVPVKVQARLVAGADGVAKAEQVMTAAVADGCRATAAVDAPSLAASVAALEKDDPRFGGVRKGDDVFDRLLHKVKLWVAKLFESAGMRAYAASARIVYLSLLAVTAAFVGVRVFRTLAKRRRAREEKAAVLAVERRRKKAFSAWRAEAGRALAAGDARAAMRAGEAALLARVGELEAGAVTPARTHKEILARLPAPVAGVVAPALGAFDLGFFARPATLDGAAAFLRDVDDAAARLAGPGASPGAAR